MGGAWLKQCGLWLLPSCGRRSTRRDRREHRCRHFAEAGQLGTKIKPENLAVAQRTGLERKAIYLLALRTGLRRREVEQLRWGNCYLEALHPFIQLRAAATKSRGADRAWLHYELTDQLALWRSMQMQELECSTMSPHELVFRHPSSVDTFRLDL